MKCPFCGGTNKLHFCPKMGGRLIGVIYPEPQLFYFSSVCDPANWDIDMPDEPLVIDDLPQ